MRHNTNQEGCNGHLEYGEHVPGGVPVVELEHLHGGHPQHHAALQPGPDHLIQRKPLAMWGSVLRNHLYQHIVSLIKVA